MKVGIIDYQMGNLMSVQCAFKKCGAETVILAEPRKMSDITHLVLPGVGSFQDGMEKLHMGGWVSYIKQSVLNENIPLLGICLGMQLLASVGYEGGKTEGLGLIPGEVIRLESTDETERIPHVGWNEVLLKQEGHPLFDKIKSGTDFYFVHSYHFCPECSEDIVTMTPYCNEFVSAVSRDYIFGTQFHPEKSQKAGFALIKNFLQI